MGIKIAIASLVISLVTLFMLMTYLRHIAIRLENVIRETSKETNSNTNKLAITFIALLLLLQLLKHF